jgi:predicted NBD/HSP70 family sugar kinase
MSKSVAIESGVVLGLGGTNARRARSFEGDISKFTSVATPEHPREFFGWMALQVLQAAHEGNRWMVAGFPGPVNGNKVGPMANVPGLANQQYDLTEEIAAADPSAGRLLNEENFIFLADNDGGLAAHAAAARIGKNSHDRVAALILGTGVGAGVVNRDSDYANVYRVDSSHPYEIGHIPFSADPRDTVENDVSGPALARRYGEDARQFSASHPAWRRVGESVGRLSVLMGVMSKVDLVVPCGGVGAGASEKYEPHLRSMVTTFNEYGNGPQKLFMPEIIPVPSQDAQVFEMFGGEGVMRDYMTRN